MNYRFITANHFSPVQLAVLVASIAAGASILSHVNDGGFGLSNNTLDFLKKKLSVRGR
ncbi:MAG: hypothetical protein V4685_18575 [Bacteroidota bacterium]